MVSASLKAQTAYFTTSDTSFCNTSTATYVVCTDASYGGSHSSYVFGWTVMGLSSTGSDSTWYTYGPSASDNILTYSFLITGTYTVTETLTSGTATSTYSQVIHVSNPPAVNFTTSPAGAYSTTLCGTNVITFNNTSRDTSSCSNSWTWFINGPTSATIYGSSMTYTFSVPGSYNIQLQLYQPCCGGFDTFAANYITIYAPPVAGFVTATTDSNCHLPATYIYTNTSSSSATSFLWKFGGGGTSTLRNPSHNINDTLYHTDTLIAYSAVGCSDTFILDSDAHIPAFKYGFKTTEPLCSGDSIYCHDSTVLWTSNKWTITALGSPTVMIGATNTQNPGFLIAAAGTYILMDSTASGNCWAKQFDTINVLGSPTISVAMASGAYRCHPPDTAAFVSTYTSTSSIVHWLWKFDDTTRVTELDSANTAGSATHIYHHLPPSSYSDTLIVTDANGCKTRDIFSGPNIATPVISINATPDSGCTPLTVCYSVTGVFPAAATYIIDSVSYGDHTPSCISRPGDTCVPGCHTYLDSGHFKLKIYGHLPDSLGGCSFEDSFKIHPGIFPPIYHLALSADSVCPNTVVTLVDSCFNCNFSSWTNITGSGRITNIHDTMVGLDMDSVIHLITPGIDSIRWSGDDNGCFTVVDTFIYVYEPTALINTYAPNCANLDSIVFSAPIATTGATGFSWHFSDGFSAAGDTVVHMFAGYGTYTVVLVDTAYFANNYCTNTDTLVLNVFPIIDTFHIGSTTVCNNTVDSFRGPLAPPAGAFYTRYIWHFGDGDSLRVNGNNIATHTYSVDGVYLDTLIVQNFAGCRAVAVATDSVHVYGPKMHINTTKLICAYTNDEIFDLSTDFSPAHFVYRAWEINPPGLSFTRGLAADTTIFFPPGNYVVCVTDTDNFHCGSQICDTINAVHPPVAFYTPDSGLQACAGIPIPFYDTINSNVTYHWGFGGDGDATTTTGSVTHHFSHNGTFTDTLIVTTTGGGGYPAGCSDTAIRVNQLTLANINVSFFPTTPLTAICANPGLIGYAINTTGNPSYNYYWRLTSTDSPPYAADSIDANPIDFSRILYKDTLPGTYTITLFGENNLGCVDSMTDTFTIGGPSGVVTLLTSDSGCVPLNEVLEFHDTGNTSPGSFIWLVNGGTPYGTAGTTDSTSFDSLTFNTPGVYDSFQLVLESGSGSDVCIIHYALNFKITAYPVPTVTVTHPPLICYGGETSITASGASFYSWSPSTGLSSDVGSPVTASPTVTTTYVMTGTTIHGCIDTASVTIQVDTPLHVVISGLDSICLGLSDVLTASGINNGVYIWYQGLGTTINGATDTVAPITTVVDTVVGMDALGCKDTTEFKVTVNPPPYIQWQPDPAYVCNGDSTQLKVFTINTPTNFFAWQPRFVGALSCDTCADPWCSITSDIIYTVVAISNYGCIDSTQIPVTVYYKWPVYIRPDTIICAGSSAPMYSGPGIGFVWTPAGSLSNPDTSNPIATPDTTTTYIVSITENVCFTVKDSTTITVVPIPIVNISGPTAPLVAGNQEQLTVSCPNDTLPFEIPTYLWEAPYDSSISNSTAISPEFVPTNTTTYTVVATTPQGCADSNTYTIHVICENNQVFIPNTFTPNGDGQNDRFYMSGRGLGLIKRMAVYNRWGQLIFENEGISANDPGAGWDGTYKGAILEPDVFIYVIDAYCETGEPFHFTGDISLIR